MACPNSRDLRQSYGTVGIFIAFPIPESLFKTNEMGFAYFGYLAKLLLSDGICKNREIIIKL